MSKPVELTAIESDYSANIYGWQDSDKNYTFIGDRLIVSSVNNFAPGAPYTPGCSFTIKEDIAGAACSEVENINASGWSVLKLNSSSDGSKYVNLLAYGTGGYVQEVNSNLPTKYADYDTHIWRSSAGAQKMDLNASTGDLTITGTLYSGGLSVTGSLSSDSVSTGDLIVSGNLTVNGTTTTINSTTLTVNDLKITLADSAPNSAAADGAGIEIAGANAEITYASTGDKWTMNKPLDMGSNNITTTGTITYNTLNDGTTALTSSVAELNVLNGITATTAELNYTSGVTSNIQTQLDDIKSDFSKSIMMGMIFG